MTSFNNTRKALEIFDAGREDRHALWENATSDLEVMQAYAASDAALAEVQHAFYEDTKEFNTLEGCLLVDFAAIQRMAQ